MRRPAMALCVALLLLCCVPGLAQYAPPDPARMSTATPVKGNILRNSSFELGWHGIWGDTHRAHPRQVVDDAVAYHGRRSVRIETGPQQPVLLVSQFVPIKSFTRYTISAYARASAPGVPVEVAARSGYKPDDGSPYSVAQSQTVGTDWSRVAATGPFGETPDSACSVCIRVGPSEQPAVVWVDAVQLEEGDPSEYSPNRPVEVSLSTGRVADIFFTDQEPRLTLTACNPADAPQEATFAIRVCDYWDRELLRRPLTVRVQPKGEQAVTVELPGSLRGSLRVQALRETDGELAAEAIVSVIPRPLRDGLFAESTIGNHLGTNPYVLRVGKMIGINWSRDHDASDLAHWSAREPQQGRFVWADEAVDRIRAAGIWPLLCLEKVPSWQGSSQWTFPRDLSAFREYVRRTVEHYRGRVTHYTVWNEGWGVSGAELGRLVNSAVKAARRADPQAKILCEYSTWQGVSFLEPALRAGANHAAIAATHLYTNNEWRLPDAPVGGWNLSHNTRRLLDEFGDMARGKPVWMTEGGLYHDAWRSDLVLKAVDTPYARAGATQVAGAPWLTARDAARYIPRYYATWRAGGGDKWFYYWSPYVPSPDDPNSFVFFECDGSLHPMAVANAVMAHELDGGTFVRSLDYGAGDLKCHVFEQFGRGVAVLWWQGTGERELRLEKLTREAHLLDMMGNETRLGTRPTLRLTGDPVYLRVPGLSGEGLAEAMLP